jgi:hypothetical protein
MTREQMVLGLDLLVDELSAVAAPPMDWSAPDWMYLRGIASAELLRLRDRLRVTLAQRAADRDQ